MLLIVFMNVLEIEFAKVKSKIKFKLEIFYL